ncbi:MarR family winged helix-turn-helix transcriptional regulator [Edaphobacter aggregans]|uniref:MarR family winged helix-turn-helix transcriptional regulator n=1 Tax=Edaphobacter aggregans TaxID=570835 RepID=UPI00068F251B|nr:MarR family winged helix-turn-helix transcriptional regulator [Edaphobacter aggregans]
MSETKQTDTSAVHLWVVLWKAWRAVEAHAIRNIGQFGMVATDFGVLEALLHKGPLTVKQIGEKVLLTSGSMTAAVDRLAARGLVVRRDDARDRRARIIELTPEGRELIERAFACHRDAMEQALKRFTEGERTMLLPLLRSLGRTAEQNFNALPQDTGADGRREE